MAVVTQVKKSLWFEIALNVILLNVVVVQSLRLKIVTNRVKAPNLAQIFVLA